MIRTHFALVNSKAGTPRPACGSAALLVSADVARVNCNKCLRWKQANDFARAVVGIVEAQR